MSKRLHFAATSLLVALAYPASSQTCADRETFSEIYECYRDADPAMTALDNSTARNENVDEAGQATIGANNPTAAPDPFAGRLHASYQDFLTRLSFAINKVEESEDGQALTVRFNPIREGRGLLGFSLTAAKPTVAKDLSEAIPATQRTAVVQALATQLRDTDDITIAASASMQSTNCDLSEHPETRCWGRSPKIYRAALGSLLVGPDEESGSPEIWIKLEADIRSAYRASAPIRALGPCLEELCTKEHAGDSGLPALAAEASALAKECADQVAFLTAEDRHGSIFGFKLKCVPEAAQARVIASLQMAAAEDARLTLAAKARYQRSGIGNLATLMDNQPQLSLTGTYRALGNLVGGDEAAVSLEVQFGSTNLNSLYRDCDQEGDQCVKAKLREYSTDPAALSTGKFVLTASYKARDAFDVSSLDLPQDVPADFPGLHVADTSELKVRLQYGRQLAANLGRKVDLGTFGIAGAADTSSPKKARWDLAVDGVRNTKDRVRTANRWVAAWSLTFPLTDDVTLPLTVTYANKPEFLTDQRESLSAHVGLSYKLPWE